MPKRLNRIDITAMVGFHEAAGVRLLAILIMPRRAA
jgi:hypothetical protein